MDEALELIKLAETNNLIGQVGHVERFNPAISSVFDIIDNPKFVECHRLAEFNPRGTDVSVVLDLMIHDIDIILSVVKSPIKNIKASGVAVISETPDISNARIEFENGCVANLTASRISLKKMRKSRFFQKNAYISVDFLDKKVEVVKIKNTPKESNEINLYSQRHYKVDEMQYTAFEKQTGIKINVVKANADELIERLKNEGEDSPADLFITVDAGKLQKASDLNLLQKISSPVINQNVDSALKDVNGYWIPITYRARIIVYSKDRVNADELSTYANLTSEEWKNKILRPQLPVN